MDINSRYWSSNALLAPYKLFTEDLDNWHKNNDWDWPIPSFTAYQAPKFAKTFPSRSENLWRKIGREQLHTP